LTRALLLCPLAVLLIGCSSLARVDPAAGPTDWVAYGNLVRALDPLELERSYLAATRSHAEMPSNDTAIRLALLVADPRGSFHDAPRAIGLLDAVAASVEDGGTDAEFARFLRGVLGQVVAEHAQSRALEVQVAALEAQLDALKALEQRLNADESER